MGSNIFSRMGIWGQYSVHSVKWNTERCCAHGKLVEDTDNSSGPSGKVSTGDNCIIYMYLVHPWKRFTHDLPDMKSSPVCVCSCVACAATPPQCSAFILGPPSFDQYFSTWLHRFDTRYLSHHVRLLAAIHTLDCGFGSS